MTQTPDHTEVSSIEVPWWDAHYFLSQEGFSLSRELQFGARYMRDGLMLDVWQTGSWYFTQEGQKGKGLTSLKDMVEKFNVRPKAAPKPERKKRQAVVMVERDGVTEVEFKERNCNFQSDCLMHIRVMAIREPDVKRYVEWIDL